MFNQVILLTSDSQGGHTDDRLGAKGYTHHHCIKMQEKICSGKYFGNSSGKFQILETLPDSSLCFICFVETLPKSSTECKLLQLNSKYLPLTNIETSGACALTANIVSNLQCRTIHPVHCLPTKK